MVTRKFKSEFLLLPLVYVITVGMCGLLHQFLGYLYSLVFTAKSVASFFYIIATFFVLVLQFYYIPRYILIRMAGNKVNSKEVSYVLILTLIFSFVELIAVLVYRLHEEGYAF